MFVHQYPATSYNQALGKNMDHSTVARSIEDAEDGFVDAKERLLDVNNWNRYVGVAGINIRLTDGHSRPVKRRAHKGDHIWVSIPGQKDCSMIIESLEYDDYPDLGMEAFTMRIHPCVHTTDVHGDELDLTATQASLIIERRGMHLDAAFQSRSIFPGINELVGSWYGLSEAQWNRLLKNFID
jgi:hypothetical protein